MTKWSDWQLRAASIPWKGPNHAASTLKIPGVNSKLIAKCMKPSSQATPDLNKNHSFGLQWAQLSTRNPKEKFYLKPSDSVKWNILSWVRIINIPQCLQSCLLTAGLVQSWSFIIFFFERLLYHFISINRIQYWLSTHASNITFPSLINSFTEVFKN